MVAALSSVDGICILVGDECGSAGHRKRLEYWQYKETIHTHLLGQFLYALEHKVQTLF